jgi:hypothetical protein
MLSGFWLLHTHFSLRMLFCAFSFFEIVTSFYVFHCSGRFAAVALSLQWLFRCSNYFPAVALSLQWLFRCTTSFVLDAAGLSKRRHWFIQVDFCSNAASLVHSAAATFTTLGEYRDDSPGYE